MICGSATSWLTKNIVNDKGGLHNRISELIKLYPFTSKQVFNTFITNYEIVENEYSLEVMDSQITLKDLMKPK